MAKKKNIKSTPVRAAGKPIDFTYTDTYRGGVTINPLAVLKEELTFTNGGTEDSYLPSTGSFYFDRPDLGKRFVLSGSFTEEPIGPTPVEGKTVFIYGKNSSGAWLNASGEVSERPVALSMPTVSVNQDTVLTVPTVTGYLVDTSVNPVDFGGAEVGSWVGGALHVTITDDTNLVLTYAQEV